MDSFEIKEEGIRKLPSGLNHSKAAGPDKLHPQVLKELTDALAQMVTFTNNALKNVSRDWKTANVAPILKQGEKYKASNYHPVSPHMCPIQMYAAHCGQPGNATSY